MIKLEPQVAYTENLVELNLCFWDKREYKQTDIQTCWSQYFAPLPRAKWGQPLDLRLVSPECRTRTGFRTAGLVSGAKLTFINDSSGNRETTVTYWNINDN